MSARNYSQPAILTVLVLVTLVGALGLLRLWQVAPGRLEIALWVGAPVATALALGVLLVLEMRSVERVQAARNDSEQRFRMAVEAARCGIWEWDLATDKIFMSEVTASLFGWRSGLVDGQQVLERVAPGHRDDMREALATAAIYGDFDVSFRVPPLAGARPVWIDFRGRGFGESPEGGFARIIGVALDVTEERLAQARAQSAEGRLRDAIESTSEAFVLWDRNGRLVMCNKNFRSYFQLEPEVLKAGVGREQVERAARLAIRQEYPAPGGRRGVREAELSDGRWVQISERPTAEGGLVVTAADITVLKTQEEARRIKEEELRRAV
ncbi:PAS-domain containing protein, partial [Phenylobacterium sp.]|uniref:PAS domain-containing protein n=1 Tax=Phenylobacterium sp. TaxID=1871053 RepID=UPI0025E1C32E